MWSFPFFFIHFQNPPVFSVFKTHMTQCTFFPVWVRLISLHAEYEEQS